MEHVWERLFRMYIEDACEVSFSKIYLRHKNVLQYGQTYLFFQEIKIWVFLGKIADSPKKESINPALVKNNIQLGKEEKSINMNSSTGKDDKKYIGSAKGYRSYRNN